MDRKIEVIRSAQICMRDMIMYTYMWHLVEAQDWPKVFDSKLQSIRDKSWISFGIIKFTWYWVRIMIVECYVCQKYVVNYYSTNGTKVWSVAIPL
jgi:hypothetical protein